MKNKQKQQKSNLKWFWGFLLGVLIGFASSALIRLIWTLIAK